MLNFYKSDEYRRAATPLTPMSDDITVQQLQKDMESAFDFEPPGTTKLARLCTRDNLLYGLRSLGAGLLSTGLTSIGCDYMMNDSPSFKLSQGLLAGIGSGIFIAGSADISKLCVNYENAMPHFQQCVRDAIVPALAAMSVYLAKSHQII